jgi:hypothetical protein
MLELYGTTLPPWPVLDHIGPNIPTWKGKTVMMLTASERGEQIDVYERETQEIIKRFFDRRLSFPECIAALDAALAGLIPLLTGEELPRLRIVMLANNETVMREMERRVAPKQSTDI